MDAIILAAGRGHRLVPITNNKPKCLVNVGGRTILDHQVDALVNAGIDKIIIIGGYKVDLLIEYCKKYSNYPINIIVNKDYLTTNNMYSLYLLKNQLAFKEFLLCNGDVIYDPQIIHLFVNSSYNDLIGADKKSYFDESMKIVVDDDNLVIDISKNIPENEAYGNSIDLYKFSKTSSIILFDEMKKIIEDEHNKNDWFEVALQRVLRKKSIQMNPFDIEKRKWVEIDNFYDLSVADFLFNSIGNLKEKKIFFFDLDGTIYTGNRSISKAKQVINKLTNDGKKVYFLSNNSSKSKREYVQKLNSFGINISEEDIILSTDAVIKFLLKNNIPNIYLIGTNSMKEIFQKFGIDTDSNNPQYVILGYDTELTYEKIKTASIYLQNNVKLIITHCDTVCPSPEGFLPDAGSLLALFEKAFAITPYLIFGKPNPEMIEHIIKGIDPSQVVITGDRLYTDIELAKRTGIKAICVLSGETKREDIEEAQVFPDLIIEDIGKLIELI